MRRVPLYHPLLGQGRGPGLTPVRTGGVTGRVGYFGPTRRNADDTVRWHYGIDWLVVCDWPVFASHRGRVGRCGWQDEGNPSAGYGLRLYLHQASVYTLYAHLGHVFAAPGATVEAGELLGYTGRTGNLDDSVPTHLHYELAVYRPVTGTWERVDPVPYMAAGWVDV